MQADARIDGCRAALQDAAQKGRRRKRGGPVDRGSPNLSEISEGREIAGVFLEMWRSLVEKF